MYAIEVEGLSKNFSGFSLEQITFRLPKGFILGYVGQNGAGKTTTIKLITNIYKKQKGTIKIDGMELTNENSAQYKERIGYIGDESYFPASFKIKDVVSVLKDFYPSFQEKKFYDKVREWELPTGKKIMEFSKGMKVKLMFAAVLARETKVLILDEATSGLDPVTRTEVLDLMQEYIADGEHSVLFSTHIMEDLEKIADYVFFINNGTEMLQGTKEEILENFVLIKGGLEELTDSLKKEIIGMTESTLGFEALLPVRAMEGLAHGILVEKPSIDQIVVYHIQKVRRK